MKRFSKYLVLAGGVCLVALVTVLGLLYVAVVRSKPRLDGTVQVAGVRQAVSIERDERGTPVIKAADMHDAAYAIGFLHAQERYFQMDLMRRKAAGELAALYGSRAVEGDKRARLHRFRARAQSFVTLLPADQRVVLRNYVAGVNEGLRQLKAAPFEYAMLFTSPQPWREEDTLLVNMAMYMLLQEDGGTHPEMARQKLVRQYDAEFADFILANRTEWDTPMTAADAPEARISMALPKLLRQPLAVAATDAVHDGWVTEADGRRRMTENIVGSNNWVVSGRKSVDGRALLANDMHLPLQQPNTFYRINIASADRLAPAVGVSVPGLPMLVAGSNGSIAWGLTNANGDWSDLVRVEKSALAGASKVMRETIAVKGGADVILEVRETRWGPIVAEDEQAAYALSWVAHYAEGNNLSLFPLIREQSIAGARQIAAVAGMPHMNLVLADAQGNAAWTIAGRIPRRVGLAGTLPQGWGAGTGWSGWLGADEYPVRSSSDRDYLWTANNRVVDGDDLKKIGEGSQFALGVRAMRIHERLASSGKLREQDMHALQLDDTAPLMKRWHGLVSKVVADMPDTPEKHELAKVLGQWNGHASVDSAAYRVVRRFRDELADGVMPALLQDLLKREPELRWYELVPNWETPLWRVVSQQPAALVPTGVASWGDYYRQVLLEKVYQPYKARYGGDLSKARWGDANRSEIKHPMSNSLPLLGRFLDMPSVEMNGDSNTVLAQSQSFGPAMRLVVSPGHEQDGFLTMPAGQSANPLSPYFRSGHQEWQQGKPLPLMAGQARYHLRLEPKRAEQPAP